MNRRQVFRRLGGLALAAGAAGLRAAQPARRPNILLIVADDMGYNELGCYGAANIETPNIDGLARQGMRFTDYYVATPLCAPTRVSLMTGRTALRTSLSWNPDFKDPEDGLSPEETTVAEVLGKAGYATGLVGKWHLGYAPKFWPRRQGFQDYFGFLSGNIGYYEHLYHGEKFMYRNETPEDPPGYMTELLTREALAYLERHRSQPFFLYLAYNAPHAPFEAPEQWVKKARGEMKPAMIECLDDGIGQVLGQLKKLGLEDNTLVFFMSDNGAPPDANGSNKPLSGWKGQVREGGIRVPAMARWPGRIPAGVTCREPFVSYDLYPTFATAGGAALPQGVRLDGKNVLPVLEGKGKSPHEVICWGYRGAFAARRGRWKLLVEKGNQSQLFDLETDIAESKDLSGEQPDMVKELSARLADWRAGLPASGLADVQRKGTKAKAGKKES